MTGLAVPGGRLPVLSTTVVSRCGSAVGQARRLVASVLGEGSGLDDVLVLTSAEVASNAVKHTASADGGPFEVAVSVSGASVRVEVGDQGSGS